MAAPIPLRPALRQRTIGSDSRLPPICVDDLLAASRAADDDRPSLGVTILFVLLLVATAIALGVAAFLIGRGW